MKQFFTAWYNSLTASYIWRIVGKFVVVTPVFVVCSYLLDNYFLSLAAFFVYYFVSSRIPFFTFVNMALWIIGLVLMIVNHMSVIVIVIYLLLLWSIIGRIIFCKSK